MHRTTPVAFRHMSTVHLRRAAGTARRTQTLSTLAYVYRPAAHRPIQVIPIKRYTVSTIQHHRKKWACRHFMRRDFFWSTRERSRQSRYRHLRMPSACSIKPFGSKSPQMSTRYVQLDVKVSQRLRCRLSARAAITAIRSTAPLKMGCAQNGAPIRLIPLKPMARSKIATVKPGTLWNPGL
jgi:hypothetical protein